MMMGPDTDPAMSAPTGMAASWLRATPFHGITVTAAVASLLQSAPAQSQNDDQARLKDFRNLW